MIQGKRLISIGGITLLLLMMCGPTITIAVIGVLVIAWGARMYFAAKKETATPDEESSSPEQI